MSEKQSPRKAPKTVEEARQLGIDQVKRLASRRTGSPLDPDTAADSRMVERKTEPEASISALVAYPVETPEATAEELEAIVGVLTLYIIVGAGKRGKTVIARYIAERAAELGNPLSLIDVEGVNPGLKSSHGECISPDYDINTGYELADFLYPFLERMREFGQSLLIDFEGNDDRLIGLCRESDLLGILKQYGVHLVVIAVTGGGSDDLVLLEQLLEALGDGSHDLLMVIAERLLPAEMRREARMRESLADTQSVAERLSRDGSDIVFVPSCDVIRKLDHVAIAYRAAASDFSLLGNNPLRIHERSILKKKFLQQMDDRFAGKLPCLR